LPKYIPKLEYIDVTDDKLIPARTGAGNVDLQARYLRFDNYTFLKQGEERNRYHVYLWEKALGTQIALVHAILMWKGIADHGEAYLILKFAATTNFVLFFFNLLPAPPLDGGWVAESLMPYKHRSKYEQYARFGPIVVMTVAMIPVLAQIFLIPAQFCSDHVYKLFGSLF
jgi:hypothetical protein